MSNVTGAGARGAGAGCGASRSRCGENCSDPWGRAMEMPPHEDKPGLGTFYLGPVSVLNVRVAPFTSLTSCAIRCPLPSASLHT
eukprot:4887625-Pyramimonas_sp.AAC.1